MTILKAKKTRYKNRTVNPDKYFTNIRDVFYMYYAILDLYKIIELNLCKYQVA